LNSNIFEIEKLFSLDSNFYSLKKDIESNIDNVINVSGIEDPLIEFFPSFMNNFLENYSFYYSNGNTNFNFYKINLNSKFSDIKSFLNDIDIFKKVEIIDNNHEFSILGDKIDISINDNIYRIIFLGEDIEEISIRDFLTFKYILSIDNLLLPTEKGIGISSSLKPFSNTKIIFTNINYDYKFDYDIFRTRFTNLDSQLKYKLNNIKNIIISTNRGIVENVNFKGKNVFYTDINFPCGFISINGNFSVLTDIEIYGEFNLNLYRKKKSKRLVSDFVNGKIYPGDYIVHINHGIGIFRGIVSREENGISKNFIEIEYANNDRLFIPLEISERITKYISYSKNPPKITRLGTSEWMNLRRKVTKDIENIAKDIIFTDAKRKLSLREYIYEENNYLEDEFNSQFKHIETKDQLSAINDVRNDLYSDKIMDRLIVGDVGFGKTEVAARASFLSVINGKQVLIVAPTTILVNQHYEVFKERFKLFPIKIGKLTRNTKAKDENILKDRVKSGEINILISTHKILSNKIEFSNLGLVIVDEEQRFGVKQKEKLKKFKLNVDYLSMTATPIPRTLYSTFAGIRDISIISTPPIGRKSVYTEIIDFNINKFVEIIKFELNRNGQVFFLHNNISTLNLIKNLIKESIPHIKIEIAFGGMKNLESVLEDFRIGKFPLLVSTSIIENGIDLPNVNTIIINQSFKFGLGQLYQFRGRVGRSEKQAYCYLVCPENILKNNKTVYSRLNTIVNNQSVGSGFSISMKDLEIRGAGDIMGVNQHGNIYKVGFDLYSQLLQRAIDELKGVI
jgi:transcription-repair coupling factor (superfamily II helicase)